MSRQQKNQRINRPRVGAIVQCTASDLYSSRDPEDYCIHVAKNCGFFDDVALAVPDVPESSVYDGLARQWGVKLVKGSNFNVADRMLKAAQALEVDIVVRLLLRRFYLDTDLVAQMVEQLVESGADYVRLPTDFNYELAADVLTTNALKQVNESLVGNSIEVAARQFAPWRMLDEERTRFRVLENRGSENYPKEKVRAIKARLGKLLGENQIQYGWSFPASAYSFVAQYLSRGSKVLDIACGQGEGSRRLFEDGLSVHGVDLDENYISGARGRYGHLDGLTYECADAERFVAPKPFDAIVSMHTLEHLDRPREFTKNCFHNLKDNGWLFLEVPLLLPRPLGEPLYPFHDKEYLASELEQLLLDCGFEIVRGFGRDRGVYTSLEQAREAIQYHCRKARPE